MRWQASVPIAAALLLVLAAAMSGQIRQSPGETIESRFLALDVMIDSRSVPLAAYQFEFTAHNAAVQLVGIEGGEHPAFGNAPYYDPAVLHSLSSTSLDQARGDRVIVAAYSLENVLPIGQTRVARLHVMVTGDPQPTYEIELKAAAAANGDTVSAQISVQEQGA